VKRQLAATVLMLGAGIAAAGDPVLIGERPAIEEHLDQARIEAKTISLEEVLRHGRLLFEARFNTLDGQGRPGTTGDGVPRPHGQPAFLRTSGPDANSCQGCHFQPFSGGAGEFASNVFALAQERDPVIMNIDGRDSNERGTTSLFGLGAIELLAREMSAELIAIREAAKSAAQASGTPVTRPLTAKGIDFGAVTVLPDGRVDPSRIEGVDWDLVVRPFHQKGAIASLREFSNTAMNHHHGMQSVERFGARIDPDGDGVTEELTIGDITALTLFQATLPVPGRMLPSHPARQAAAERGERLFASTGCAACHRPELIVERPVYADPGPFNPPGNLRPAKNRPPVGVDLTLDGPAPRLERLPDGRGVVRAFTDLKRHDLNDAEIRCFANEQLAQGTLAARVHGSKFTESPLPRPTQAFLTARLWDVGSTAPYGHRGDLTTLTEAIRCHGGEGRAALAAFLALPPEDQAAVIEFLKTLQILPEGSS
jgi:cytochrome c553